MTGLIELPLSQVGSPMIVMLTFFVFVLASLGAWVGLFSYDMFSFAHMQILCVLTIMLFGRRSTHMPDNIHIVTNMQESRAGASEGVFNVMYVFYNGMVSELVKSL